MTGRYKLTFHVPPAVERAEPPEAARPKSGPRLPPRRAAASAPGCGAFP
ncbi:hypothetical protein STTU_0989 [Streptomyces sp. Tu6071]|nr:hypothetical protein STTU_0989 [Streptomyces sp. Tu6071]